MSSSTARWSVSFVVVSLFALLFFARALPERETSRPGSVLSTQDRGRRALFLLCSELGWDARAWTEAPADLPRGEGVLFLGAPPAPPPGYERPAEAGPEGEPEVEPDIRRTRDPRHYRRFVEQGGVLLAAFDEDMQPFLARDLGLAPFAELEILDDPGAGRLRAVFGPEDDLKLSLPAKRRFAPLPLGAPFEVLATDVQGAPRVLALELGRGRVCVFTPGEVLDNQRIADADNALFFVRILERLEARGPLFFDEYALGGWTPESPLSLALSRGRRGFTLHLLLALALFLWSAAWVGPFAREPAAPEKAAPRERARALAALFARAGRFELLGRALQAGVARALVPGRAGSRAGGPSAPRAPVAEEPEHLRALRPLAVARLGEAGWEEARAAFSRTVRDERALEELERELAAWERRLAPGGARGR